MQTLFISSVSDAAGKNMLIAGIGQKMRDDKYNIGFLKPIANKPFRHEGTLSDEDVLFFHKLFDLSDPPSRLSSLVVTNELYEEIISGKKIDIESEVSQSIQKTARDKDVLLIKGLGRFYRGSGLGTSELDLIKKFKWQTILIDGYRSSGRFSPLDIIDGFIMGKKALGNLLLGVVFNSVPDHSRNNRDSVATPQMEYIKRKVIPFLSKEYGIDVLGIIPADAKLKALSIREIKDMLKAEILSGTERQDDIIENFCLSTMNMENDIRYFRQVNCKAVITSGDRPEIQLASLETDTKCLILTGKLYPPDIVLSKAEENNIPVLVVRDSSLETDEKIERLRQHLGFYTPSKIPTAIKIVQKNVNIKALYKKLGLV